MGTGIDILEGSSVRSTGKIAQVPVGDAFLYRVVDSITRPQMVKVISYSDSFQSLYSVLLHVNQYVNLYKRYYSN